MRLLNIASTRSCSARSMSWSKSGHSRRSTIVEMVLRTIFIGVSTRLGACERPVVRSVDGGYKGCYVDIEDAVVC